MTQVVRITKADDSQYWYSENIGEVFEVEDETGVSGSRHGKEELYYVSGTFRTEGIRVEDAIVVGGTKLTQDIVQWAVDRNLHTANPDKQMLKLFEETGELAAGMAKGRQDQIVDSIGDIYVVLTILATQLGIDIEECIAIAYDEIKDRRGKMVDGVFVKEADLPHE